VNPKKPAIAALLLGMAALACARQGTKLDGVAAVLFKSVKTKLTVADKNAIAAKTGFVLSGNKDLPFASDNDSKEYPFGAVVLPTDMNKDGQEEIFISFGNTFTSGMAGSSIALFIRDAKGAYADQLGFPGLVPDALEPIGKGYPDLLIGGPGFEYPVWSWNGKAYVFSRTVKDADYSRLKKLSVEEISKAYQQTIKE
jgi:hypothetical protein